MKLFQKLINLLKMFGINANKIELSAEDVFNLLAGNTINIGTKKIKIASNNFNVDEEGNVTIGGNINNPAFKVVNDTDKVFICPTRIWLSHNGVTAAWLAIDSNGKGSLQMPNDAEANFYGTGAGTEINSKGITTPELSQTSLESIKKNIKESDINALEIIKNAKIYSYNLKAEKDTDKKHIGFVIGDNYNTPDEVIAKSGKGIDTYTMASLMWKALQESNAENEKLKQRIEKLEART